MIMKIALLDDYQREQAKDMIGEFVSQIMAANMADEAQSWLLQPDGRFVRYLPDGRDDLFNCHRFFMDHPSLSGRGTAGAGDVPALTHSND